MNAADLVAEACLLFGWTVEETLQTEATQFFTMMSRARKMKKREHAYFFLNLCDVVRAGNATSDAWRQVRDIFAQTLDAPEFLPRHEEEPENQLQGVIAQNALISLFRGGA